MFFLTNKPPLPESLNLEVTYAVEIAKDRFERDNGGRNQDEYLKSSALMVVDDTVRERTREAVRGDVQATLRSGSLRPLADGEAAMLLGRELARVLGVVPGDSVTVISPQGALTAVGMVPKMRRYTVAGTIEMGMYELDASLAYLALPAAQEFAGLTGVTGIEVKLTDPFDAKRVGRAVAAALGFPFWVRDWMDMNRNLFAALQLEKYALFVVVTIIVLVAAFAIIGHLVLLVAEKRKEIGILKAVGASARSITAMFFAVGMTIGVVGTVAGSAVGLAVIWAQNTYKVIRLAGDVYQIDYLPMKLTLADGLMVVGATLLLSFLATLIDSPDQVTVTHANLAPAELGQGSEAVLLALSLTTNTDEASLTNLKVYLNANGFGAYRAVDVDLLEAQIRATGFPVEIRRTDPGLGTWAVGLQAHYKPGDEELLEIS